MSAAWPEVALDALLAPVSRGETVEPDRSYNMLGAHWYARGLYVKSTLPGSQIKATTLYRVQANDFVYNRLFAWKGAFALAGSQHDGCYVSNEFPCFRINSDIADSRYVRAFFSHPPIWDAALGLSTGVTAASRNRLKQERLLGMTIPLPPLGEQRRIVARIEQLSARIEQARSIREKLPAEGAALAQRFVARLFDSSAGRDALPIEAFAEVRGGIQKCSSRAPGTNARRYLTVAHVQRGWVDAGDPRYFEVTDSELARWRLEPGDVLVVEGNGSLEQIGRAAVFRGEVADCVHQNHVIRVRTQQDRVLPEYLIAFLNSDMGRREMVERSRTTSGLYNLSVGRIKGIRVPVPELTLQADIVSLAGQFQAKCEMMRRLQAEVEAELVAFTPALLAKAFRGEL